MHRIIASILLGCMASTAPGLHAQAVWPNKPVKLIVSQAAGSSPDLSARRLADRLSREFPQPFVVENRSGAGGAIAAEAAARANDGHTFFVATLAPLVLSNYLSKNLRYDPVTDFVGIAKVTASPFVLVANKQLPVRSLGELVALDKAQPGKLSFASDGVKNLGGLIGEMFNQTAGTKLLQVPYNSTARAATDTIGGQTQLSFQAVSVVVESIKSGDLRPLGLTSGPLPVLSDVPLISATIPGFDVVGFALLVGPKGTPPNVIAELNRAVNKAVQEPAWQQDQIANGSIVLKTAGSPTELDEFLASERRKWGGLIERLGIKPE